MYGERTFSEFEDYEGVTPPSDRLPGASVTPSSSITSPGMIEILYYYSPQPLTLKCQLCVFVIK